MILEQTDDQNESASVWLQQQLYYWTSSNHQKLILYMKKVTIF